MKRFISLRTNLVTSSIGMEQLSARSRNASKVPTKNELKPIVDAHLSSQEETIFGGFLEGLSVFICGRVFSGKKSSAEGIDLEFERDGIYYIVSIKSGPNWGNSSQIKKMRQNFAQAKRILGTNTSSKNIVAVNGCCYGQLNTEDKGDYLKKCGQSFWSFVSGDNNLYTTIIEPLGHRAKERNEEFQIEYGKVINRFTAGFIKVFCQPDGTILWEKLVQFNSAILIPNGTRTRKFSEG
ncbi:MAG: cytosolic protein [Verrucomicrobia bacterium]|nr:cytosolic protein [Verrucomicrobiota bacterium]